MREREDLSRSIRSEKDYSSQARQKGDGSGGAALVVGRRACSGLGIVGRWWDSWVDIFDLERKGTVGYLDAVGIVMSSGNSIYASSLGMRAGVDGAVGYQ